MPDPPQPGDSDFVPWGIDRTDQRALPLSQSFKAPATGQGVIVYIVDTGISPHPEFDGRLATGVNVTGDGGGTEDCDGHGTHVAGTIGGTTVGMADEVQLVPVRIFDCFGQSWPSLAIAAFDWIAANHPVGKPGVINYSVGGLRDPMEDAAASNLVSSGLTFVTSAGNESSDACPTTTAADTPGVIVVGATDIEDRRESQSNVGPCVDLFAPGGDIVSTSTVNGYTTKSGTSMASPHVAGAAAILLSQDPWRLGSEVESQLLTEATTDVVVDTGGSANRLLYSDPERVASPAPDRPAPPEASPTGGTSTNVAGRTLEAPASSLAFTGGDPRAMLLLASFLLVTGFAALVAARRREEQLVADVAPVRSGPALPIEIHRQRR